MMISSSFISMNGTSVLSRQQKKEEVARIRVGNRLVEQHTNESSDEKVTRKSVDFAGQAEVDRAELSVQSQNSLQRQQTISTMQAKNQQLEINVSKPQNDFPDFDVSDTKEIQIIEKILAAITGKKVKLNTLMPKKLKELQNVLGMQKNVRDISSISVKLSSLQPESQSNEEVHTVHQISSEAEKLTFTADGIVKTADGKEINFSVALNMSREFVSEQNIDLKAQQRQVDPLVINLDSNAPALTKVKYSFDIDSDGDAEQLSFTGPASGFLALDKNENGEIDNGQELFGPSMGNGFRELIQYDDDKNNWIDENDSIYHKLRIWTKDEKGSDRLLALGQVGVGAIYLGSTDTQFSIKDENNQTLGEIKRTGVYLKDSGEVGTIQHIDLSV